MIAVIADDITGAAEIAGVCLRLGVPVSFSLDVIPFTEGVLVIATDTRSMFAADATWQTGKLSLKLIEAGVGEIFKKTDSVLRGHVSAELRELTRHFKKEKILLVPANPYTKRSIRGGNYYVNGVPLDRTDFRDDPEFPAFTAAVHQLVKPMQFAVNTGKFTKNDEILNGLNIPDTENMDDLLDIAALTGRSVFPAGSAAFFEAYIRVKFPGLCGTAPRRNISAMGGKGILVAGSNHFQTHDFIKDALSNGIKVSEMPKMLKIEEIHEGKLEEWQTDVRFLINNYGKVILTLGKIQVRFDNCANILKERLARIVAEAIKGQEMQELMVSGGATVYAIIRKLGWKAFIPVEEFSPGVVRLMELHTGYYLTIKPGSYEWPEEINRFFTVKQKNHAV